jgi:hypothetical protein
MTYRLILPLLFLTIACHAAGPEYFDCIMEEYKFNFDEDTVYQVTYVTAAYVDGVLHGKVSGIQKTIKEPTMARSEKRTVLPGAYLKDVRIRAATEPVTMKKYWHDPYAGDKWYHVYWEYEDFEIPLTEKELKAVKIKSVKSKVWGNGTTKECVKIYTRSE